MKKILIIISAVLLIGCNPDPTPQPLPTPTTATTTGVNVYNFVGNWDCYDWVVDETTGTTRQRRILFSYSNTGPLSYLQMSMNQYNADSTFQYQLFTFVGVLSDTNYFDMEHTGAFGSAPYKGYLMSDTTLMVYQYLEDTPGIIDTFQSKLFIKE